MDWDQQGKLPRLHPSTPHMDPASLNITATSMDPGLLDLPWHLPLEDWPKNSFAALPRGISPHVVRFARMDGSLIAVKETSEHVARQEYQMLRKLRRLNLPSVEPVAVITGRHDAKGQELQPVLVTKHLRYKAQPPTRPTRATIFANVATLLAVPFLLAPWLLGGLLGAPYQQLWAITIAIALLLVNLWVNWGWWVRTDRAILKDWFFSAVEAAPATIISVLIVQPGDRVGYTWVALVFIIGLASANIRAAYRRRNNAGNTGAAPALPGQPTSVSYSRRYPPWSRRASRMIAADAR